MENIIDILKGIVYLFISVFAFLPSWVNVFVGSVTLLLVALLVYKLIRG